MKPIDWIKLLYLAAASVSMLISIINFIRLSNKPSSRTEWNKWSTGVIIASIWLGMAILTYSINTTPATAQALK